MTESPYGWWLPPDVSTHGAAVDSLINVLHWFMGILFLGWGIFFVYCLIRFRRRTGHQATYQLPKAAVSKWSEIGVAVFEAIVLLGFSMPAWAEFKNEFPDKSESLEVRVIAEQFAWNFHYPGADGQFGRTDPTLMDAENLIGLDREDPAAADDVVTNGVFHIPAGKPVIAYLTSKDVIHSFWPMVLRVKQDVIPGMEIPIWFQSKKDAMGHYEIACAQLCGNNHYNMRADLFIDTATDFEAWLASMASDDDEEEEEEGDE